MRKGFEVGLIRQPVKDGAGLRKTEHGVYRN
jgi:hypothetical protein